MIAGKRIFVTGASGFIGRAVVARLKSERCGAIVCLSRGSSKKIEARNEKDVKWVRGSLLEPESYENELRGSDAVIHLAASTGNATAEES